MFRQSTARLLRLIRRLKWFFLAAILLIPVATVTGMQLENHDGFCASCHTDPETEYVARTLAPTAIDLASFHHGEGSRCIDCHSGEGTNGRLKAMTLGAQDLLSYFSGQYPQPAPLTQPISDEHCLKCHSDIPEQRNFKKHYHYFLDDWQRLSDNAGSCTECHQSHSTDGSVQIAFLNSDHTSQVCQRCHNFNQGGG